MKRKFAIYWKVFLSLLAITVVLYLKLVWLLFVFLLFALLHTGYTHIAKIIPFLFLRRIFKSISFLLFVFCMAASIKILLLDIYIVPSNSMEELFFSGDVIAVNKLTYGPKLPQSPFEIPWINILFYYNDKARSRIGKEWWPCYRLSGYGAMRQGDLLVFQFEDVFVTKRCVALPGDTIAMINGKVVVNHKNYNEPKTVKNLYIAEVKNDRKFYRKIESLRYCCVVRQDTVPHRFIGNFSYRVVDQIKVLPEVKSIYPLISSYDRGSRLFVNSPEKKWTLDNMGPLIVPKKGMKILLTEYSINLYENVLREFEKVHIIKKHGKYFIDHKKVDTYTITQNYYFVLGDNRKSSDDSRVIGFVPYKKIIGKVQGILYKKHPR